MSQKHQKNPNLQSFALSNEAVRGQYLLSVPTTLHSTAGYGRGGEIKESGYPDRIPNFAFEPGEFGTWRVWNLGNLGGIHRYQLCSRVFILLFLLSYLRGEMWNSEIEKSNWR